MPIDFHSQNNRTSYTKRQADQSWCAAIRDVVDVRGKSVIDIGCGGGIYSKALVELGAAQVTGVDFSEEMLLGAAEHCGEYDQINFVTGNALNTNLPSEKYDVIVERALIHHIKDLSECFAEAFRLLKAGGTLIVQDRTAEDCLLPGSQMHIRGYFFSYFPRLADKEVARRHSSEVVQNSLKQVGFQLIEERKLWETRRTYTNVDDLKEDLLARTGRSILHDLTDSELLNLANYIQKQWQGATDKQIIEQDRWSIWSTQPIK
jgi:ubiquinone/menaquinone biosynthesis C-methylase UbiE